MLHAGKKTFLLLTPRFNAIKHRLTRHAPGDGLKTVVFVLLWLGFWTFLFGISYRVLSYFRTIEGLDELLALRLRAPPLARRPPAVSFYAAPLVRFRPFMLTPVSALLRTLPIALGYGAGSESRRPLGLAVVGGLVVSQTLTLYITPVVYTYMDSFLKWRRSEKAQPAPEAAVAGEP